MEHGQMKHIQKSCTEFYWIKQTPFALQEKFLEKYQEIMDSWNKLLLISSCEKKAHFN